MNKLTEDELSLIRARFLARRDMPEHYTGIRKEYMMVDAQADMEKLLDHIDTLQDELDSWRADWAARRIIRNPNGTPG